MYIVFKGKYVTAYRSQFIDLHTVCYQFFKDFKASKYGVVWCIFLPPVDIIISTTCRLVSSVRRLVSSVNNFVTTYRYRYTYTFVDSSSLKIRLLQGHPYKFYNNGTLALLYTFDLFVISPESGRRHTMERGNRETDEASTLSCRGTD